MSPPTPPTPTASTAIAIIPARAASERFPEKLLADATGRPLIAHVCESVQRAERVRRTVVATDDTRIAAAVDPVEAVLTSPDHPNGTSRLAECAEILGLADDALVVNVQGDEPEIEPHVIDACIDALSRTGCVVSTVATPVRSREEAENPNVVKVAMRPDGRAMYFSRSPIPFDRSAGGPSLRSLRHVGIYGYRAGFLRTYASLPETPLEHAERLEQLRVLEHGFDIAVAVCRASHEGIDTPEQYAAFVERYRQSSDASA